MPSQSHNKNRSNHQHKRRRVYVVNQSGHDYSLALSFGDIVYMSHGEVNRSNINLMYRQAATILENSHKEDYIVVSGLASQLAVLCACFAFKHGKLNLLIHDGINHRYDVHRINIWSLIKRRLKR